MPTSEPKPAPPNAWLIPLDDATLHRRFSVAIRHGDSPLPEIAEGDGALVAAGEPLSAVSFARVCRVRVTLEETTLYFDRQADGASPLTELGIEPPASPAPALRLEWPLFAAALKTACDGLVFEDWPEPEAASVETQTHVRELLRLAVIDDLLGPADGPHEEIVGMSVRDRYLVGKLAPMNTPPDAAETDGFGASGRTEAEEGEEEGDTSTNQSLVPSSMGLTFCVDGSVDKLLVTARWGRYERTESERVDEKTGKAPRCWKRIPSGGSAVVSLDKRTIAPFAIDENCPGVLARGTVSPPLADGDRLVTLFLVNTQTMPEQNQDYAWIFQPELIACDAEGRAVFRRRPIRRDDEAFDEERESLEMIYRKRVEFAVGHGVSVHAAVSAEDPERATEIRTAVLPEHEVPATETPGGAPEDRPAMRRVIEEGLLDMERLADLSVPERRGELVAGLRALADDYAAWIDENRTKAAGLGAEWAEPAAGALERCGRILARLREGVETLERDDRALAAFRFANRAMALQRIRGIHALAERRGEDRPLEALDIPQNRTWRPFQPAFMLLAIPALADPAHRDRSEPVEAVADLLWFPTGGGKTEAYLGVAAFAMAVRRLQGDLGGLDSRRGLTVIMRYTLRLLTLQQFQRAATLVCAMEVLRRKEPETWGDEPFTLGLWVGRRVTPNDTGESAEAIAKEREGKFGVGSTPAQLTACPWCGEAIAPGRDIVVDENLGRTVIHCGDKYGRCEFGRAKAKGAGLPVLVVDEEIYRRPPSMLIATVDKFAMMAWRGQARTLFGKATRECPRHGLLWPDAECTGNHPKKGALPATAVREIEPIRPPDLIIQDEFHLIGGPLGTMVGLYESAVDELAAWTLDGKTVRPKIVASTATARKAREQVNDVFLRRVAVFPPHGLDVEDNFFAVQRAAGEKPGRLYMGVCAPGASRPAALIRVHVALLTAAQWLFERFGAAADPYMTVVGYFNSLRELGGMRRLAEDDVQTRAYRVGMGEVARPGLAQRSVSIVDELTSRVANRDIPKKLDHLELGFKRSWAKGETRAIDIVLATNMLSVGVDVGRLGLMAVNGQPKNTAEYIQATSRVGRAFPGLVCTALAWSRPRDLSHYETFEHYHATFYKHVEAQSVTPFAPRALDRGLTGALVSLVRLENEALSPNEGAGLLVEAHAEEAARAREALSARAWKVKGKAAKENVDAMLGERIDRWASEAARPGRKLGYETARGRGDLAALLRKPGAAAWGEFTVPLSMREVEPGVRLIMDASQSSAEAPPWKPKSVKTEGGEA